MTSPRRQLVEPSSPGYFHCVSRCVRRAFLCGFDAETGDSFEHRRPFEDTREIAPQNGGCPGFARDRSLDPGVPERPLGSALHLRPRTSARMIYRAKPREKGKKGTEVIKAARAAAGRGCGTRRGG